MRVDLDISTVVAGAADLLERARTATQAAAVAGAVRIVEASQPLVPIDTHELFNSAFVRADGDDAAVGGYGAPHAAYVHEIPATHSIGGPKFLERAVNAVGDDAVAAAAAEFDRVLAGQTPSESPFPTTPTLAKGR